MVGNTVGKRYNLYKVFQRPTDQLDSVLAIYHVK